MIGMERAVTVISAATLSGLLLCSAAGAQTVTVEQFQHPKGETEMNFNKAYLIGIKDGLLAYNMSQEGKYFCIGGSPPELSFERASDILVRWARKRNGNSNGLPLGLAMLYSLRDAFPCQGKTR
jgi:Ssp1 endopeptidase immunity protein Rap1a